MRPHSVVSMFMITPLLGWALNSTAQVPPTPTPTATPRLLVTAKLSQVSGHSIITCTVKNSSGKAVSSQKVTVQKAAAITGPFADWMSKKTNVNGQALLPYAQPTYTWYVRCAAARHSDCTARCSSCHDLDDKREKAEAKPDCNARTDCYCYAQADGHSHAYGDSYAVSDCHAQADGYSGPDSHAEADCDARHRLLLRHPGRPPQPRRDRLRRPHQPCRGHHDPCRTSTAPLSPRTDPAIPTQVFTKA